MATTLTSTGIQFSDSTIKTTRGKTLAGYHNLSSPGTRTISVPTDHREILIVFSRVYFSSGPSSQYVGLKDSTNAFLFLQHKTTMNLWNQSATSSNVTSNVSDTGGNYSQSIIGNPYYNVHGDLIIKIVRQTDLNPPSGSPEFEEYYIRSEQYSGTPKVYWSRAVSSNGPVTTIEYYSSFYLAGGTFSVFYE